MDSLESPKDALEHPCFLLLVGNSVFIGRPNVFCQKDMEAFCIDGMVKRLGFHKTIWFLCMLRSGTQGAQFLTIEFPKVSSKGVSAQGCKYRFESWRELAGKVAVPFHLRE